MPNPINEFIIQGKRPLPVIVAVDRSGSMSDNGKIQALNLALNEFLSSLKNEDAGRAELQIAIFSFGDASASFDQPLVPVSQIQGVAYSASGGTPMGDVFQKIKALIEDTAAIPHRAYKPSIVLLTDGQPTDEYVQPLAALVNEGRSAKAFRIAMAIGEDADRNMLAKFVSSPEYLVTSADARDIKRFFQFVTMSVTQRLKSQSPNAPQPLLPSAGGQTISF